MTDKERLNNVLAAITYALEEAHDGLEWLRSWVEGDKEAMQELENYLEKS